MKPHFHIIPKKLEESFLIRHHILPNLGSVWHFHPEIELHYIVKGQGVRFIGDNISNFDDGELLLLGKNLPHMWRCNDEYFRSNPNINAEAIVIQFLEDFMGNDFLNLKESSKIVALLEMAKSGIIVGGKTKNKVVDEMKKTIKENGLKAMLSILNILVIISSSDELKLITTQSTIPKSNQEEQDRINRIISFTLENYKENISLEDIAQIANLSVTSFCRYFKMMTQKTYVDFLLEVRISQSKRLLIENDTFTTESICFESGFNNKSNFFRHFKNKTGLTPVEFRKKFISQTVYV